MSLFRIVQEAVANAMDNAQATWDIRHLNLSGPGVRRNSWLGIGARYLYEARDGSLWVTTIVGLVHVPARARHTALRPPAVELVDLIVNGGEYQDFPQLHFHLISDFVGAGLAPAQD